MKKLIVTAAIAALVSGCAYSPTTFPDHKVGPNIRFEATKAGKAGVGSGVYIGNGVIITAAHVLDGAENLVIKSEAGDVQAGRILWVNTDYDIAAVAPDNPDRFRVAHLACREPSIGENISATGNPFGLDFITMRGYVSGESRRFDGTWEHAFPADLTTIGGMSGGATYDEYGDVIGVTVGTLSFNGPAGGLGVIVPGSIVCKLLGRV